MKHYLEANCAESLFTNVVPVTGVDQVKVTFSKDVFVGRSSIGVPGKENRALAIRDFSYDAERRPPSERWPARARPVR